MSMRRGKSKKLGRKPRRLAEIASGQDDPPGQQSQQSDDALPSIEVDDTFVDDPGDPFGDDGIRQSTSDSDDGQDEEAAAIDVADLGKYRFGPNDISEEQAILDMANYIEIQHAAEYEERVVDAPEPDAIDFDAAIGQEDEHMAEADEPPPASPSRASPFAVLEVPHQNVDPDDISQLLEHRQNRFQDMSKFEKGLAMFVDLTGMSRTEYDALRELLHVLKCEDGQTPSEITKLPAQLATLKSRIRSRLPLSDMRKAPIPLKVEKLPTLTAQGKRDKGKGRAREFSTVTSTLHFFDPTSVFVNIMSSDIQKDMHIGPAHFVDEPTELYHAHAWASSVRTSSGIYPHLPGMTEGEKGAVIFPSDFIYYCCQNDHCGCHAEGATTNLHIGRVYGFGYDRRSSPCAEPEQLVLQVQEAFFSDSPHMPFKLADKLPIWDYDEVVLTSDITYVPERNTIGHIQVYVDRLFGETQDDPQPSAAWVKKSQKIAAAIQATRDRFHKSGGQGDPPSLPKIPESFPKYRDAAVTAVRSEAQEVMVRRMICGEDVVPLCHTHAIRAELEMQVYKRDLYEVHWDRAQPGSLKTYSLPLLTFIDGFGVFRNSYRSLMGFYVTPASLPESDRCRESSVFPIALGPHGSDFGDVVKALHSMKYLDEGIMANINRENVRLCAFTMCYTGDMPQQAENSGFKGPRAHKCCRFCFVAAKPEGAAESSTAILDIDIVEHGRYHIQTTQMQHMMSEQLQTASDRREYGSQWGFNETHPPLTTISPALDLILSRPPDAAHSEYKGITNLMHFLLRDGILSKDARIEYATVLRSWPFPPGAQRLMSPIHHLASYSLSDHARWSIITPVLLRAWLKEKFMVPKFVDAVRDGDQDPVEVVVATVAAIAKSNSVLMGRKLSARDRDNMTSIVRQARTMFNQLNIYTSQAVMAPTREGSMLEEAGSRAGSAIVGGELVVDEITVGVKSTTQKDEALSKRAKQYLNDTVRPNAHIAIHYPQINEEYALVKNVDSLEGESFHRIMRNRVYETNFSNIEKVLLEKINVAKTIRLVLRNGALDDVELTSDLQQLYQEAPSLFRKVLSETDRARLDQVDAGDFELDVEQSTTHTHLHPSVISRVGQKEVAKQGHAANEGRPLPVRAGTLSGKFQTLLRSAYEKDYGFAVGEPVVLGNAAIQWSRKFAFLDGVDETRPKVVFAIGDHVRFHGSRFGRVDAVFVFDCMGVYRHIFIVLTELHRSGRRDHLLDLDIMDDKDEPVIVGVPAIDPVKLYMVPVDGIGTIFNDWDVYYL